MDPRFFKAQSSLSFQEVKTLLVKAGLWLHTEPAQVSLNDFKAIEPLNRAGPSDLSFFHNAKYLTDLTTTNAGAILVPADLKQTVAKDSCLIRVHDVHRALALIGQAFLIEPEIVGGIHATAVIETGTTIDPSAQIGPHVFVGAGAKIGARSVLQAGVSLGPGVEIGSDCHLDAHVTLSHAIIGDRVHIKPGAALGQRGFGWALSPTGHVAKPQIGRVLIGDDVEIGANCTIDRGSVEDTVVGEGSVLDNLCHIAHNCKIGRYCALAATTAFAGSTVLGDYVIIGGGVGSKGHVHIGDGAVAKAWSFIGRNVKPGEILVGNPARPPLAYQRVLRHWSRIARGTKGA